MAQKLRAVAAVCVAAAVAFSAAGCGDDGPSAEEVARSEAAAAQAAKVQAAKEKREAARKEMLRYLARSREANRYYQRARQILMEEDRVIAGRPITDPTVPASGRRMVAASDRYAEASVRQRLAQPPKALRTINVKFAKDMARMSDYADEVGGALRAQSLASLTETVNGPLSNAGGAVRNEWRVAVTAYARQVGVEMPAWTKVIGRRP